MRVGEQDTARCETVDIWCQRLWVPLEATNPIVEIVDGNEQHVGAALIGKDAMLGKDQQQGEKESAPESQGNYFTRHRRLISGANGEDRFAATTCCPQGVSIGWQGAACSLHLDRFGVLAVRYESSIFLSKRERVE